MEAQILNAYRTRGWHLERFADTLFMNRVPSVKWDYFTELIRPLADEATSVLYDSLFAGVGRPFHPGLARGWMGEFFKQKPRNIATELKDGESFEEGLCNRLEWGSSEIVFLVFARTQVYLGLWSDWLNCFRRDWVSHDTSVLCCESSPKVAVFWEGFGPYFAKRGKRKLFDLTSPTPDTEPTSEG